ncbi:hypothetical protein [Luedemannella flava]|uniref:hypothetical protein n=1 Tax=Luedemannella flava TaxID=349316 RepID=UPI0031E042C9
MGRNQWNVNDIADAFQCLVDVVGDQQRGEAVLGAQPARAPVAATRTGPTAAAISLRVQDGRMDIPPRAGTGIIPILSIGLLGFSDPWWIRRDAY